MIDIWLLFSYSTRRECRHVPCPIVPQPDARRWGLPPGSHRRYNVEDRDAVITPAIALSPRTRTTHAEALISSMTKGKLTPAKSLHIYRKLRCISRRAKVERCTFSRRTCASNQRTNPSHQSAVDLVQLRVDSLTLRGALELDRIWISRPEQLQFGSVTVGPGITKDLTNVIKL